MTCGRHVARLHARGTRRRLAVERARRRAPRFGFGRARAAAGRWTSSARRPRRAALHPGGREAASRRPRPSAGRCSWSDWSIGGGLGRADFLGSDVDLCRAIARLRPAQRRDRLRPVRATTTAEPRRRADAEHRPRGVVLADARERPRRRLAARRRTARTESVAVGRFGLRLNFWRGRRRPGGARGPIVLWSRRLLAGADPAARPPHDNEDDDRRLRRPRCSLLSSLALLGLAACGRGRDRRVHRVRPEGAAAARALPAPSPARTGSPSSAAATARRLARGRAQRRRRRRWHRRQRLSLARRARDLELHAAGLGRPVRRPDHHRLVPARRACPTSASRCTC